jgi:hypothetical protein
MCISSESRLKGGCRLKGRPTRQRSGNQTDGGGGAEFGIVAGYHPAPQKYRMRGADANAKYR